MGRREALHHLPSGPDPVSHRRPRCPRARLGRSRRCWPDRNHQPFTPRQRLTTTSLPRSIRRNSASPRCWARRHVSETAALEVSTGRGWSPAPCRTSAGQERQEREQPAGFGPNRKRVFNILPWRCGGGLSLSRWLRGPSLFRLAEIIH